MKRMIVMVAITIAIFTIYPKSSPIMSLTSFSPHSQENSLDKLAQIVKNNKSVVVKVFQENCPPCLRLAPFFEQIAQEFNDKIMFVEINGHQHPSIVDHYKIRSAPTLLFFKNGQLVKKENASSLSVQELRIKVQQYCLT